jgi:hypothetical protein
MISFKTYLTEGRSRGEAMEDVIVSAVNGKPQGDDKFGISARAGVNVAKFLAKNKITGKARVLGADTLDVSPQWAKFWEDGKVPPSTRTPKTDFIVGKAKISLKSGDAAQLMSGGRNESLATFYTALEKTSDIETKVAKKLTTMFEGLAPSSVAAGDLRTVIAQQKDEIVNKANTAHKALMKDLKKIFETNTEFRDAFAYEAMSGEVKFGGNDGTCTHFLVTTFDGEQSSIHSVKDKKYVSKIANQMKVSVRFKTTSVKTTSAGKTTKTGEYRYWSVVGLIVDKMQEDLESMDGSLLTEAAIFDFFKGVWNRIKNAFKAAVEYVKKGVKNVFDFLEVQPEISLNNRINF